MREKEKMKEDQINEKKERIQIKIKKKNEQVEKVTKIVKK